MSNKTQWLIWLSATIGLSGFLAYSLVSQPSAVALTFLPGVTTHGHFQIELQCHECHSGDLGAGVSNNACIRCHGEDLDNANDTHPKSKFTDPGLAHLTKVLDGRSCLSCHKEHAPQQTHAMGLSLPTDYCWHCHQEVGDSRPSHKGLAYDSCATSGCHNYHDNRPLSERFLANHFGEPDVLEQPEVLARVTLPRGTNRGQTASPLTATDHDAPAERQLEPKLIDAWANSAHAAAGVNCTACHQRKQAADRPQQWSDKLTHEACQNCHTQQVATFLKGRHGGRLAVGLKPMTPGGARLPMNHDVLHRELNCVACHGAHEFDTRYAAVRACLQCHNDEHSRAYQQSPHYQLWQQASAGLAEENTGVTCATCHMPREKSAGSVVVQHNQNDNLRPNEKMSYNVCRNCHGVQFSLDALADSDLIRSNFQGRPDGRINSLDMAKAWFQQREQLRLKREQDRNLRQRPTFPLLEN